MVKGKSAATITVGGPTDVRPTAAADYMGGVCRAGLLVDTKHSSTNHNPSPLSWPDKLLKSSTTYLQGFASAFLLLRNCGI